MSFDEGRYFAKQLLKDHKDVDGVFINTDLVSIGAIAELNEQKIKVPEQISIVGFSNWFMSSVISPSLTTIDQPGDLMGKTAFKLLFKEIKHRKQGKVLVYKDYELPTELIIRKSTKHI